MGKLLESSATKGLVAGLISNDCAKVETVFKSIHTANKKGYFISFMLSREYWRNE